MDYRAPLNGGEMKLSRPLLLIALLVPSHVVMGEETTLGRLFLTPQQRTALDRQRQRNPGFLPDTIDNESSQTLNGLVRRSSGRNTQWINGEANWNGDTPRPGVAVGETLYPTGEREGLLGGGRIVINPVAPSK